MCKLGGGDENRCLKHHVVSKFVVKIVTVRTKADEAVVSQTLSTLNKEGKNLPNPEPEVVKNWLDTEKFKTEYDPDLNNHDRKIQMNRLNSANPEKVKGSHFHAWKNLERAVRSKVAKRIGAAGLVIGMSASLVGCFATGGGNQHESVPTTSPTTISAPATPGAPSSPPQVVEYGHAKGSGEQVKVKDGSYEKVTLNENAPIYKYNEGGSHPENLSAEGWSEKDAAAGQKLVADYMVKEFVDSSALEGGDKAYDQWHQETAKKYYSSEVYNDPALKNGGSNVILGNFGGNRSMPNLIHDGKPREKSLELELNGFGPYQDDSHKGIEFSVSYNAEYRVDDKNAIDFAAHHSNMSEKEFLASPTAKSSLKDGKGENVFKATGTATVVVGKNSKGHMEIIGFYSETEFDTSNFTGA